MILALSFVKELEEFCNRSRTLPLKLERTLSLLVVHIKAPPLYLFLASACVVASHQTEPTR